MKEVASISCNKFSCMIYKTYKIFVSKDALNWQNIVATGTPENALRKTRLSVSKWILCKLESAMRIREGERSER